MASYTRTMTETSLTHNTTSKYTTTTDIFTVTAGHIYILKQLTVRGFYDFDNAGPTGAIGFEAVYPGGSAEAHGVSSRVAPPASAAATRFFYEFAWPNDATIVTALPATTVASKTIYDPGDGQEQLLHNRHFYAGEILRFSPLDSGGAGLGDATNNNIEFNIMASYIDFTI